MDAEFSDASISDISSIDEPIVVNSATRQKAPEPSKRSKSPGELSYLPMLAPCEYPGLTKQMRSPGKSAAAGKKKKKKKEKKEKRKSSKDEKEKSSKSPSRSKKDSFSKPPSPKRKPPPPSVLETLQAAMGGAPLA
eukprot:2070626-Rhodomonas_salina.1